MDNKNRLFVAWDKIYCLDLSESSIKRAIVSKIYKH